MNSRAIEKAVQFMMEAIIMNIDIDIEELREDLLNESYGAFFGGGFGGALMESFDIRNASAEELIQIAKNKGIDLRRYEID